MENAVKFLVRFCCSSFLRKRSSKAPRIFHGECHATFHATFCSCKCPISWRFSLCRRLPLIIHLSCSCCEPFNQKPPALAFQPCGEVVREQLWAASLRHLMRRTLCNFEHRICLEIITSRDGKGPSFSQKTREGCGCFRDLFGGSSRKNPGKFRENSSKFFPNREVI